ncbi:MAG: FkbM family methyltransferase [Candidatus Acidiferrum sp.]
MAVTEALWRLTDPNDIVVDAGANIGYMSSILALRTGKGGSTHCFEPHPLMFERLKENTSNWSGDHRCSPFVLYPAALGNQNHLAYVQTAPFFSANQGTAWVSSAPSPDPAISSIQVQMVTLDQLFSGDRKIGILKMDVQGVELSVLEGMSRILSERRVRDIVFEEIADFPAPTHQFLKNKGYYIFGLEESLTGLKYPFDAQSKHDPVWGPEPNYLATVDPARAISRLKKPLWRSFGLFKLLGK